jgi:uroporphyrinogen-III synthase
VTVLAGVAVLVTRPQPQGQALSERLAALGADAVAVPTIEIEPLPLTAQLRAVLETLPRVDWLVFVSRNAVRYGLQRMRELGLASPAAVAAVGPGSAAALAAEGVEVALQPQTGFDSEALLALPQWQDLRGAEVVILRGVGGRELLGGTLAARGARVRYAELYRRRRPPLDLAPALERWRQLPRRALIVTSGEGLDNLLAMAGDEQRPVLTAATLITVSERVAEAARAQGFQGPVVVASRPDNDGLIEAVLSVTEKDGD